MIKSGSRSRRVKFSIGLILFLSITCFTVIVLTSIDLPSLTGLGILRRINKTNPYGDGTAAGFFSSARRRLLWGRKGGVLSFKRFFSHDVFMHAAGTNSSTNSAQLIVRDAARHLVKPKCAVFSCSHPDYWLLNESLTTNPPIECDRFHFSVHTYKGPKTVSANWCRVPILRQLDYYLPGYERVMYTDLDLVFREHMVMKADCTSNKTAMVISKKLDAAGKDVIRTSWILLCRPNDQRLRSLFSRWDKKYRNVRYQDQDVFNEEFKCGGFDGAIKCVNHSNMLEVIHCGSFMPKENRLKCMRKRY